MNVKLCECGCGLPTAPSPLTRRGYKRGEPQRFIVGHYKSPGQSLETAFQKHFVAGNPDECWPWQGPKAVTGYGRVSFEGKRLLTHRVSYELHNGAIPEGMHVCHRCDNPICVNPGHLFLGTQADNVADMIDKGRENHSRKLTKSDANRIRQLYADGLLQREIAEQFGVLPGTVSQIVNYKIWVR